jgi:hypothetical protein
MVRTIAIATALVLVTASSFSANAPDRRGYVQQSTGTVKPAGLYGVGQLAQRSYEHDRANSVKGTKPQRGNTERELMDLLSEGRRN